jgi:ubiquinone/menaquinone biosynthesis C-methylase UbiE
MSFYNRRILPWLISHACATKPVMRLRAKVVPHAEGRVLELGIGSGLNLPFYDLSKVESVSAVDPSAELRTRAAVAQKRNSLAVSIVDGTAEALPFDAATFDSVVCTFTLCSVQSPSESLSEARRVLKPGGRLFFCEHGMAPDAKVVRWQRRIEPVWKRLAGGCHLTRPIASAIAASGFSIERQGSMYMPGTPRIAGWVEWGSAIPE